MFGTGGIEVEVLRNLDDIYTVSRYRHLPRERMTEDPQGGARCSQEDSDLNGKEEA
jgi:hypothetical protein